MSLAWYLHRPQRILRKLHWQVMQTRQPAEMTADTWNGRLTFNSSDRLISKFLYVRQAYEQQYLTEVMQYLDQAGLRQADRDVVLDVGANIGMIAIALVKHGWFSRAVAFEPEPYNFGLLTKNVQQNGYAGAIACRQLALSAESGSFNLVLNEGNLGGHFISNGSADDADRATVRIRSVGCDEILAAEFASLQDRIGLVWMDIEGHEGYFLQGATQTLAQGMPVVSEFYPTAIERSGMSRQQYLSLVNNLFTHVCTLVKGRFVEQPISAVEQLLEHYQDQDATNVIFLRR